MKWLIYHGDTYYPYEEVFQSEIEARKAWDKQKKERMGMMAYWQTDYLCQIIDKNDREDTTP